MILQNEICGRNFLGWLSLLVAVFNLIVGIWVFPSWYCTLIFFMSGGLLYAWLDSGIINSNFRMINNLLKMNKNILDMIDNKIKEKEKQKEVKKK